ncbi:hypothetical protein N7454_010104 [Penicillium verhagenii]|nr:hypothetical protein N7454_010104 [Penicillium verhagenii]
MTAPIVFIVRHGARLDAADKDWHLTSPTPYDPPLCYGGWIQSRALGARIASLLQNPEFTGIKPEAESSQSLPTDVPTSPHLPPATSDLYNRYNVIIHTSPYLRCLQTSIAISTGLNALGSDLRPLVRVDAFLGEWLSPDYFDQITPPPGSDRMIALAKAELLRRGERLPLVREGGTRVLSGHFPGGWGSQSHPTSPNEDDDSQPLQSQGSLSTIEHASRPRASTFDVPQGPALGRLDINRPAKLNASYVAPVPGYAVSPAERIPSGYVSHARDACVKIDYQWDSMRAPYWGSGGEYGEEWSSMQERVSESFQKMMEWYQRPESSAQATMNDALVRKDSSAQTVIIIVTHGAGCNALINSLAGHPVLLDIGTASVTLAVPRNQLPITTPDSDRTKESFDQADRAISRDYALQLVASTDHLRPGTNPSQLNSLTPHSAPQDPSPQPFRNRLGSRPQPLQGSFPLGPISGPAMSPRGWALAPRPSSSDIPRGPSGLWGAIASPIENEEDANDFVPNFGDQRPVSHDSPLPLPLPDAPVERTGWTKQLPKRTLSQRGLWGSAPSLEDRELASRRRWTLAEQKL